MTTIEIDFDVYKALTLQRESESTTYNDVIRRLLGLDKKDAPIGAPSPGGCLIKGIFFPDGTQFRKTYKGRLYRADIKNGAWTDENGRTFSTPSAAAVAITRNNVNGWRFWEYKRPGDVSWRLMATLLD